MTCPACNVLLPISARRVQTCPTCARSLVVTEDSARLATAADIRALEPHEIDALRKGRSHGVAITPELKAAVIALLRERAESGELDAAWRESEEWRKGLVKKLISGPMDKWRRGRKRPFGVLDWGPHL